ncbi:helix-turn-helix domain-containing protein [Duganella sp. BuS-21]|uniref:helix-turn-helix domain-containing protein n=1 Tax=Duganella sp. BuS-21 TaxID=2943848 RepID=UPI0035A5A3AB
MKTIDYLDAVKTRHRLPSDYALAKRLGVAPANISSYRSGRRIIDDDMALAIALELAINPLQVIATANIERAKTPEQRERWSGVMEKFSVSFRNLLLGYGPHAA